MSRTIIGCTRCRRPLPRTDEHFPRNRRMSDGFGSWCRDCCKELARRSYQEDPERRAYYAAKRRERRNNPNDLKKSKDWWLRHRYGITVEQYEAMLAAQGGACAICRQPEVAVDKRTGKLRMLAVDHDHATRMVRGLLCASCNTGLARLEISGWAEAATAYLEKGR